MGYIFKNVDNGMGMRREFVLWWVAEFLGETGGVWAKVFGSWMGFEHKMLVTGWVWARNFGN